MLKKLEDLSDPQLYSCLDNKLRESRIRCYVGLLITLMGAAMVVFSLRITMRNLGSVDILDMDLVPWLAVFLLGINLLTTSKNTAIFREALVRFQQRGSTDRSIGPDLTAGYVYFLRTCMLLGWISTLVVILSLLCAKYKF
jgi:hypothetical protein